MGVYTELNIGVDLALSTPGNVIKILDYMLGDEEVDVEIPDHPLFQTERWRYMLRSDSSYFDGRTDSSMVRDAVTGVYALNVRCNLKNYDGEISKFLDFIFPYVRTYGFIGYTRYEEFELPYLIWRGNDGMRLLDVCTKDGW